MALWLKYVPDHSRRANAMTSSNRVFVKGVRGRVAYSDYRNGKLIPVDNDILVEKTAWIDKRVADGDIVIVKAIAVKSTSKVTGEDK